MVSLQQARHSLGCHSYSWKEGAEFLISESPTSSTVEEFGAHKDEQIHTILIARVGEKSYFQFQSFYHEKTISTNCVFCTI